MQREHYELNFSGDELTGCLKQLNALDEGSIGTVCLFFVDGNLIIERRLNKKNHATIELTASGHWPFPIKLKWSTFVRLLMKENASIVKLQLVFDRASGNSKFIANGIHLSTEKISTQLSLELSELIPESIHLNDESNQILKRIQEIDKHNKASGVTTKDLVSKIYERDVELNRLIKELRGEACQICGYYFLTAHGERYVECHHLEHLANDGLDVSKNMLVVCANHHRQLHHGKSKVLHHTLEKVTIEIDGAIYICQL